MDTPQIIAYLKTYCGWSAGVRAVLAKYNLPYTEKDIIPTFLADVNRRFLLGGDSDAIAWPRVQLDDLFLLQFVFRPNNRSRIVGRVFQVVNDHALDFRAERRHQVRHQVVRERALLGDVAHEHGDGAPDRLIDIDNKN